MTDLILTEIADGITKAGSNIGPNVSTNPRDIITEIAEVTTNACSTIGVHVSTK